MTDAQNKTRPAGGGMDPAPGKKRKKWWIVLALVLAVAVVLVFALSRSGKKEQAQTSYTQETVARRSIVSSLSDSGQLQPANSYTVTTLLQGEILSDTFNEGDVVEKDTVLYQIDSSDASDNIERAQLSLDQAQRSYENAVDNAYIRSQTAGTVAQLNVDVGDQVNAGQQIAVIRDSGVMRLTVPFPSDDAAGFYIGQAAEVTLDGTFETLYGTVDSVSGSESVGMGNMLTRNVTIAVANPGALGSSQAATASVNGVRCAGSGTFVYQAEGVVTAGVSGTVQAVNVQEGQSVAVDQVIVTLGGKSLTDQIQSASDNVRSAQLSMNSNTKQLEDYTIKSPISGTIVEKNAKAGDTVATGKSLCVIYDLSYLEMTLNIDELDISKVEVGQAVQITAEAVEGRTYTGEVTRVSVAAVTTAGGGTAYPVTVRLDETEGLWPGMNVDAEIVLEQADNVLAVPNEAVQRGGAGVGSVVLVTADSPSAAQALEQQAPEGYVYVAVTTGVSDDGYIQILSGLREGDVVAYVPSGNNGQMLFMMGGMEGGGMEVNVEDRGGRGGGGPMG